MTVNLSRRTVLALLAGSGVGVLVGCSGGGGADDAALDLDERCAEVDRALRGLAIIGVRYRELHPDDDPVAALGDLPDVDQLGRLAERVTADFAAGDVVDVDGWILARTEARAAAALVAC